MHKKLKVEPPSNSGCETDEDEDIDYISSLRPSLGSS